MDSTWSCPLCTFINEPLHLCCNMCQTQRPKDVQPVPAEPKPEPKPEPDHKQQPIVISPQPQPVINKPQNMAPHSETATFLSDLVGHKVPVELLPHISNIAKKKLNMEKVATHTYEWLQNANFEGVVRESIERAEKAALRIQQLVQTSIDREEMILESKCARCNKTAVEVPILHLLEACSHEFCNFCIREYTLDLVKQVECQAMRCPFNGCSETLPDVIIKQSVMPNEFVDYQNAATVSLLRQDSSLIQCPNEKCKNSMVLDTRSVVVPEEIGVKSEDGKLISREAWIHYNKFRLRCRACGTNLCAECNETPYHINFTCASFKEYGASKHCRFCGQQLTNKNLARNRSGMPALADVCKEAECLERREISCDQMLDCGHACGGVKEEKTHLPCLKEDCPSHNVPQSEDDYCNICYVEGLGAAPTLQLKCGHVFHGHCVIDKIKNRWPGVRITFGFLRCPLCPELMDHESLEDVRGEPAKLYEQIKKKSLFRLKVDGLEKDPKLTDPSSKWYGKNLEFAMNTFAYYNCKKCKEPYFGGRRDCEQNADAENRPADEFVCYDCSDLKQIPCNVPAHKEYHLYKCRFCCSVAVWFCWGTTHFCEPCHSDRPWERAKWARDKFKQCKGRESCVLKQDHPPNGSEAECEFTLGCAMCADDRRKQEEEAKKDKEIDKEIGGEKKPAAKHRKKSRREKKKGWGSFF